MEFNQKQLKIKSITPVQERKPARFGKKVAGAAATVLAAFMLASPLVSGNAYAQEKMKPAENPNAGVAIDLETGEHEKAKKKNPKSKKMNPETKKIAEKASKGIERRMAELDYLLGETGQGGNKGMTAEDLLADPNKKPVEGAGEAPTPGKEPKREEGTPQKADAGEEEKNGGASPNDETGKPIVTHNLILAPDMKALGMHLGQGNVLLPGMVGERSEGVKNNGLEPIDTGINVIGNEAGTAVFGSFRYLNLIRIDAGAIFFDDPTVPLIRLLLSPELKINIPKIDSTLGMGYLGSIAFADMTSYMHNAHSVVLFYTQPLGKHVVARLAGIFGGSFSYPAYDNICMGLGTGLSLEFEKMISIYSKPKWVIMAPTPMGTLDINNYGLIFDRVDSGIQAVMPKGFVGRAFADIGIINEGYGLYNRFGFYLMKMIRKDSFELDVGGGIGMTQWSRLIGGGMDPMVMAGMSFSYGGDGFRSTNRFRYSHSNDFGLKPEQRDIPGSERLGPYGFGKSGDPYYDVPINEAKEKILNSASFAQFTGSYSGASEEQLLMAARFMTAFMGQVAYANDAYDAITSGNIFDPEVGRIANMDYETMMDYLRAYISWYQNHGSGEPLPESLKGGMAVCSGMHALSAKFLRENGIDAFTVSVSTPEAPHMVLLARIKGKTYIVDYGRLLSVEGGIVDALNSYGKMVGAPNARVFVFADEYVGKLELPAGELLDRTIMISHDDFLDEKLNLWKP